MTSTLQDYFAGMLALGDVARAAREKVSVDGPVMQVTEFRPTAKPRTLTCADLVRVCDDWTQSRISEADLARVAFWIHASEEYEWDSDTLDGAVVAETISNWSSPEIDYRLTDQSMKSFQKRLLTRDLSVPIHE